VIVEIGPIDEFAPWVVVNSNTRIWSNTSNNSYICYMYDVPVVTWDDKTVSLNRKGHRTKPTVTLMNSISSKFDLGYTIYTYDMPYSYSGIKIQTGHLYFECGREELRQFEDEITFDRPNLKEYLNCDNCILCLLGKV
jgi:hypothetical protein